MESNISLKKKFYGVKKAHNDLDRAFNFLLPKDITVKEFFRIYNKMFFDLSLSTHNSFLSKSTNYAFPEGYTHPKKIEEADLRDQLFNLQRSIDSIEREHFFFQNNRILVMEGNTFNNSGNLASVGEHGPYFMHSGKKRKINDIEIFRILKTRFRSTYQDMTDDEVIIPVSLLTLNGIPDGPPINVSEDIYKSNLEVNIYPVTLDEYDLVTSDKPAIEALPIRDTD